MGTTVLHILLIPNNYPLEYIITDAVGTFLAIITMFLLLRMECTEILHEAEELWIRQGGSDTISEAGSSSTSDISETSSHRSHKSTQSAIAAALARSNNRPTTEQQPTTDNRPTTDPQPT